MSRRPILLDLFCGEGGASVGYTRAGFDVVGVELEAAPLRRYPFMSKRANALWVLDRLLNGQSVEFRNRLTERLGARQTTRLRLSDFAAIHASPPCQAYSVTRYTHSKQHPQLVEPVRERLVQTGLPYVLENVPGAPLRDPLMLCGSEFELRAFDPAINETVWLQRHRLFESNVWLMGNGGCRHPQNMRCAGAYGGGSSDRSHAKNVRRGGYTPSKEVRAALLGIDWMTLAGQAQSLPPVYTQFIGEQLLAEVNGRASWALTGTGAV